jgi:ABC-2 type transport system ATP-binding protein
MITTTALTKSYGKSQVVRNVSLHCAPGTITGFLGPNGAGKSTTLRMVLGLSRPDSGTSTIAGRPFTQLPNPTRVLQSRFQLEPVLRLMSPPDHPTATKE